MANTPVGRDAAGNPIDVNGKIVPGTPAPGHPAGVSGPAFGQASVTTENLSTVHQGQPAGYPDYIARSSDVSVVTGQKVPAITVTHASVEGVSINLPAGASVNSNGTLVLADGTPVNPLDIIRAWRNGQTHL